MFPPYIVFNHKSLGCQQDSKLSPETANRRLLHWNWMNESLSCMCLPNLLPRLMAQVCDFARVNSQVTVDSSIPFYRSCNAMSRPPDEPDGASRRSRAGGEKDPPMKLPPNSYIVAQRQAEQQSARPLAALVPPRGKGTPAQLAPQSLASPP